MLFRSQRSTQSTSADNGPSVIVNLSYNGLGTLEDANQFGDMVEDVLTSRLGMKSIFGGVNY